MKTIRSLHRVAFALAIAPIVWCGTLHSADLESVYEMAKEYDARFSAARYDLEAARQSTPQARSAFLPQLTLGGEAGFATLADDGDGPFQESALTLNLRQSIFNRTNGKLLEQAEQSTLQAEAQYQALAQALILRVATAYFDVLRAEANVELSNAELEAISEQLEQAERRFDVGLVPITDVRSVQARRDLAVAQEIAATNQLATTREALLLISGESSEQLSVPADDLPLMPPMPAELDAWVDLAPQQNLELVSARLANERSHTQIAVERAGRYPTVDLVGSASSSHSERVGLPDSDAAQISVQLQLPLLTGGRINSQVAQARALARASDQQLLAQIRTTKQTTRDSYRNVQAAVSQVNALQQALVSTEKSAEATEAGFRAGTRTSVDVLQALRDTFRAKSDYAGARYDYIINSLNLKAAAGTLSEADVSEVNRFLIAPEPTR